MNMKNYRPAILAVLFFALIAFACTRVEDNTRSSSLLVVESVVGEIGGEEEESTPLFSDVCDNDNDEPQDPDLCGVFNDNAIITFANEYLQIGNGVGTSPTFMNDIVVNRYRVDYIRPNGRNTPGVDVPFGIDGTMTIRVPSGQDAEAPITVVRHEAKREPPLDELTIGQTEGIITAQAEIKFFGQDLSGRSVSATGYLEIHFGNYGEDN